MPFARRENCISEIINDARRLQFYEGYSSASEIKKEKKKKKHHDDDDADDVLLHARRDVTDRRASIDSQSSCFCCRVTAG